MLPHFKSQSKVCFVTATEIVLNYMSVYVSYTFYLANASFLAQKLEYCIHKETIKFHTMTNKKPVFLFVKFANRPSILVAV